ncbi:MAG TPA: hypothetical protein VMT88_01825 [Actinomycetes bacterium]|nr:hypothetical protein [Actinomycetes bacterium]
MGIVVFGLLIVLLACGAVLAVHAETGSQAVKYESAQAMATKAGCGTSFHSRVAHAGVTSTGECTIDGSMVVLVVLPTVDAAYAWFDGANAAATEPHHGVVGDGWVAYGDDSDAMNYVARSLTTS